MIVGIDFGITNTDIALSNKDDVKFFTIPTKKICDDFLLEIFNFIKLDINQVKKIAVTGGKSSDLSDSFKDIPIIKVNEVNAIGFGAIDLYSIDDKPFVAISTGTGTACIYHSDKKFNHLGGISIGGGTLQGLSNYIINTSESSQIEELAASGKRESLDLLIGEAVNEIGSLYPEITASNFVKAKNTKKHSSEDLAASLSNMIGEVIGTISYLNAMICGLDEVYFIWRTSLNKSMRKGIEDRLKLANVKGSFAVNREYGNVLGALKFIKEN